MSFVQRVIFVTGKACESSTCGIIRVIDCDRSRNHKLHLVCKQQWRVYMKSSESWVFFKNQVSNLIFTIVVAWRIELSNDSQGQTLGELAER